MSTTPFEQRTNRTAFYDATGRVLINGLGLGMLLAAILRKPDVKRVRVIEHDADVIALVGPTFATDERVKSLTSARSITNRPKANFSISFGMTFGTAFAAITFQKSAS